MHSPTEQPHPPECIVIDTECYDGWVWAIYLFIYLLFESWMLFVTHWLIIKPMLMVAQQRMKPTPIKQALSSCFVHYKSNKLHDPFTL